MIIFPQQERVVKQIKHVLNVFVESEGEIRPHFHLTGPSGSGKTFILGNIAEEMKIPFMEVNAAGITAEGLSGNSLSKALRKLREHWDRPNIIFVDEFDKLFLRNGEHTEGFRSSVQDEFLTALENKYTSIFTDYGKYEPVLIENSLFIFAGSYSNQKVDSMQALKDAGLRREFIGRVPLVFYTEEVPVSELTKVIPKLDLFKKYKKINPDTSERVAAKEIASVLEQQNKELGIGIRLLNSAVHQYFMKAI